MEESLISRMYNRKVKSIFSCLVFFVIIWSNAIAARIDTVSTYSAAMQKQIKAVVITPDAYPESGALPMLYLLHGWSGNYADWVTRDPEVGDLSDLYRVIIVCPDGGYDSWYFDSKTDTTYKYETYVSHELVAYVDKNYKTVATRAGRAITGLSMGGHGALYLAFRHQDIFGAAGSMSGGVDFRPFPDNWGLKTRLGSEAENQEAWDQNTVINLVHLLRGNYLALIFDCGTEDFFYPVNKALHKKLMYYNIPHDFISRPGKHNWDYWTNSVRYQIIFFTNFFKQNN